MMNTTHRIGSIGGANQLTARDLVDECESNPDGAELYMANVIDDRGNVCAERAQVLWYPEIGRGGVAWGGNAVWSDAASVRELLERVIETGDVVE